MEATEIDPLETKEQADEHHHGTPAAHQRPRLSSIVAITIALLATFMGVCKLKSDNIAHKMQLAETERVDDWNWYQARNIRQDIFSTSGTQLQTLMLAAPVSAQAEYQRQIAALAKHENDEKTKKAEMEAAAKEAGDKFDRLSFHHDQFDISEAGLTVAISVLAITALTGAAWLYYLALLPAVFGIVIGIAGLCNGWQCIAVLAKFLGA